MRPTGRLRSRSAFRCASSWACLLNPPLEIGGVEGRPKILRLFGGGEGKDHRRGQLDLLVRQRFGGRAMWVSISPVGRALL